MEYSIIIPTTLKDGMITKCLQSLVDNTTSETRKKMEVIVMVNSHPDKVFIKHDPFFDFKFNLEFGKFETVWFGDMIGYTKATNIGLMRAKGEYVILMNDDCEILPYAGKDAWLNIMREPFKDPSVGMTGPKKLFSKETGRKFLVFFLVMVRKALFEELGMLDETFNPGGGEDIDFCARAEKAGYRLAQVPDNDRDVGEATSFPVWHQAEKTVHSLVDDWENKFQARMKILENRTKRFEYDNHADVTAYVSTKGRYDTSLPLLLSSIVTQTLRPKSLVIFQDDPKDIDYRNSPVLMPIFRMLDAKGIGWEVLFGEGKGQVKNHQRAIDLFKTEWIWRLDDDNIVEPDVLEGLCRHIDDKVGAIAGAVVEPSTPVHGSRSSDITLIDSTLNYQWIQGGPVLSVDHLYSTFLFRRDAAKHGYNKELSPVGHREETLFTHEMKRNGWNLIVDPNVVTWHVRQNTGGIRSYGDAKLWDHDEVIFRKQMEAWKVKRVEDKRKWINLDCGIGDTWMAKKYIEKMIMQYPDSEINVACCYPSVLDDIKDKINIVSIAHGRAMLGDKFDKLNMFLWCMERNWNQPLSLAFEKMYLYE